ncbi:MAG: peptidylprolyl isomerase [Bryobacteraceae bacterium]
MFDLFRSRAKAVRYLLGALLMLVAISMVVTLVPGFGTGGGANEQIVAEIGKDVITTMEVQQTIQMQLRGRSLPPEMAAAFVPQLVDQMITENVVAYQAGRMGLQVSEQDLSKTIQTIFPQLFEGGKFAGKDVYAAYLAQQNMSIEQFENNLKKQLLLNKLRNLIVDGSIVSPADVEREYRRRYEKLKVEYAVLTPDKFRAEVTVSPEEMQSYFGAQGTRFRIPEKRSFQMLVVDEAKVAASFTVPETELRRAYNQEVDRFRVPERVHARHILLKTADVPKDQVPKIQAKAEDLLKQVRAGADFAELAKKNSEDPGSAVKGGDLGWIVRGQTVKAFEETAFSLKPNQISNLVTTQYGFHILQVIEKETARLRPFEEVRAELETERKRQSVYERMQTLSDQAHAALVKKPLSAPQIATEMGLQLITLDNAASGDPLPEIGPSQELWDALGGLQKGEVTPVVQVQQTKLAVAAVTNLQPSRQAQLSEVEGQIRNALTQDKLNKLIDQRANELAAKAKSMNGNLKSAAQSAGAEWKTPPEFERTGAVEGMGSAAYLERAFTEQPGAILGPMAIGDKRFVCKVLNVIPADMSGFAAQRATFQQELKQQMARQRNELFEEGLRDKLIEEGKVKIHQDVIKRIVANYTGR